ncbi:hypothetical protein V8E52_000748 [Russula decolorans]
MDSYRPSAAASRRAYRARRSRERRRRDRDSRSKSWSKSISRSRSRSRSRDRDHHGRQSRSRTRSRSGERGRARSDSRSWSRSRSRSRSWSRSRSRSRSRDRRGRHRKRTRRSRTRSRSKSRSRSRERKRRRKRGGKKNREKRERRKNGMASAAALGGQWGKNGIISESDIFNKEPEFRAWLVEERKMNPERMSKDQNKKEFARFVEDYNTATFPNEKFYNIEAYERRMDAMRAGEFVPPTDDSYDAEADMRAHQSKLKRPAVESESFFDKDQLQDLRRVQRERVEAGKMKLLGMDIKSNMGVRMDLVDG